MEFLESRIKGREGNIWNNGVFGEWLRYFGTLFSSKVENCSGCSVRISIEATRACLFGKMQRTCTDLLAK